jgi:uncharacterized protein (DUF305 family)
MRTSWLSPTVGLLASVAYAAEAQETPPRSPPVQAGAAARPGHTAADVRFMQGMIAHHGQAVTMSALVPARTTRQEIRMLAERIDVSQQDEIAWMRTWLADRGEAVPAPDSGHAHHEAAGRPALMPGMLTEQQLAQLAAATGVEFERLFLSCMIRHHEGAITMVAQLFGTPGAGQEPWIFEFATDVDADQRAEIERMRAILRELPQGDGCG